MSLTGRLRELRQQQQPTERHQVKWKILQQEKNIIRQQKFEARKDQLSYIADEHFRPILSTVNSEFLFDRAEIYSATFPLQGVLSATSGLIWDNKSGSIARRKQHELIIGVNEINNMFVIGGGRYLRAVDNSSDEWKEGLEDAVIEILGKGLTYVDYERSMYRWDAIR